MLLHGGLALKYLHLTACWTLAYDAHGLPGAVARGWQWSWPGRGFIILLANFRRVDMFKRGFIAVPKWCSSSQSVHKVIPIKWLIYRCCYIVSLSWWIVCTRKYASLGFSASCGRDRTFVNFRRGNPTNGRGTKPTTKACENIESGSFMFYATRKQLFCGEENMIHKKRETRPTTGQRPDRNWRR